MHYARARSGHYRAASAGRGARDNICVLEVCSCSMMTKRLPRRCNRSSRRRRRRSNSLLTISAAVLVRALTLDVALALPDKQQQQQQKQSWGRMYEREEDEVRQAVDSEAALRFGHHVLRSQGDDRASVLSQFDTLTSGSGFPAGDILFLLGRAHDEGREDIGIMRDEIAARELYERGAKLGHPGSQHALSVLLASSAEGGGEVEAILYDFFASMGGDALAHAAMGYRYMYGLGTVQDCAMSLQHYLAAAKETIADLHSEGRGRIQRQVDLTRLSERLVAGRQPLALAERELADYWRAASLTGDITSIRGMGHLHLFGNGEIEQDLETSYKFFSEGAKYNDAVSTAYAGDMLMRGAGVEVDYEAALEYFEKSKSTLISLNGLGYLYYHGLGVEQDIIQAYDYFTKVKSVDHRPTPETLFNLGKIFSGEKLVDERGEQVKVQGSTEDGEVVLSQDMENTLLMYKMAAAMGHVEAAFHAALTLLEPQRISISTCKQAVKHLKDVVERGPWMEEMRLGLKAALDGDYSGALVHYSRLAEIGSEVAQSNAAWLLESGHCGGGSFSNGTQVSCEKRALRLYEHAARQGRASAEMKVGGFYYHGKAGLPVDYEKAAQRYLKAANAKHAEALFAIGYMYQTGKGVAQDLPLAKRFYDDAARTSEEAIAVVRVPLILLRAHAWWMSWRDWWRDTKEVQKSQPLSETGSLLVLTVLLVAVMLELARRRTERARRDTGDV